jgi:hypothetical protein
MEKKAMREIFTQDNNIVWKFQGTSMKKCIE